VGRPSAELIGGTAAVVPELDRPGGGAVAAFSTRSGLSLTVALLGFFVITLDGVVVNVALPSIRDDLGAGMTGLQWVVDGYTLMFAALLLSAGSLIIARSFQGAAAAVMMPSSMALIGQAYPDPVQRARAVALWAMGGAAASSSGPVLGGVLTLISWRTIFFVNVPVGVVALVLLTPGRVLSTRPGTIRLGRSGDRYPRHRWADIRCHHSGR
jgi:MFS family permease